MTEIDCLFAKMKRLFVIFSNLTTTAERLLKKAPEMTQ